MGVVLGQPYIPRQDKTTLSKSVSPKQFDLYIQDPTVDGLRANRINLKAARSMGATIELPTLPSADNMIVRVEGDLRRTQERNRPSLHVQRGEGSAEVVVALQPSQQNSTVVLNLSPATIPYSDNWTHFLLEDRVPTKLLSPEKKSSIYIAVYPGRWLDYCGYVPDKNCGDVQFSHLHYEICAASAPDVANKTILFY